MQTIVTAVRTFVTVLLGVTTTILGAIIVLIIAPFRPTSPVIEKVIKWWSYAWLVPAGSPVSVVGRETVDTGKSYVVVANHLSNLDVMACFLAVPLPIRFLAKAELFKIPLLAPAMRVAGIVEVDRKARSAVHAKVNRETKRLIETKRSVIIYPEGTRSRDGTMNRFKKGAFTMAVAAQLPVLPVTIQGTYEAWPPGSKMIRGGPIRVVIDEAISTKGLKRSDVGPLRDKVEALIETRLREGLS